MEFSPPGSQVRDVELGHWLTLCRAPGLGPRRFAVLLHRFGSVTAACNASAHALRDCGLSTNAVEKIRHPDVEARKRDLAWLAAANHRLLVRTDPGYPRLLAAVDDAPIALFAAGDTALLARPQVAIVGTRRPSVTGLGVARALARDFAAANLVVTSGLAHGIDAAAHAAALHAAGSTIAVLGCGIDRAYPAANRRLARQIETKGLLVSEFPPGVPPLAGHFPRRNRVISGLSLGVVVVEAARRSGSLITARLAGEQGRDVFAVPGSVRNPMSAGCHALLRDGAGLVESAADVIGELQPGLLPRAPEGTPGNDAAPALSRDEALVLEALGFDASNIDELAEATALPSRELMAVLLQLELRGCVSARPGGRFERYGEPC